MLKYPTKNAVNAPKFDKDLRLNPLYAMRNAMEVPKIFSLGQKGLISNAIIRVYTFNNYSSHVCDIKCFLLSLQRTHTPKDLRVPRTKGYYFKICMYAQNKVDDVIRESDSYNFI